MKRLYPTRPRMLACVLGASALLAVPMRSRAQEVVQPAPLGGPSTHPFAQRSNGLFHGRREPIPRTYSYYYDTWFNQPRHFRVVGEDGKVRWRTTVRGLPRGTPWTGR